MHSGVLDFVVAACYSSIVERKGFDSFINGLVIIWTSYYGNFMNLFLVI